MYCQAKPASISLCTIPLLHASLYVNADLTCFQSGKLALPRSGNLRTAMICAVVLLSTKPAHIGMFLLLRSKYSKFTRCKQSKAKPVLPSVYSEDYTHGSLCVMLCSSLSYFSCLTHWGRDVMAEISQKTFSSAFSWMKTFEFRLRFHWSLFPSVRLTVSQYWFRYDR